MKVTEIMGDKKEVRDLLKKMKGKGENKKEKYKDR